MDGETGPESLQSLPQWLHQGGTGNPGLEDFKLLSLALSTGWQCPGPCPCPKACTSREGRAKPSAEGSELCQVDMRWEPALAHLHFLANPPSL